MQNLRRFRVIQAVINRENNRRALLGREFQQRVQREYSADAAMGRIVALYDAVLGKEI